MRSIVKCFTKFKLPKWTILVPILFYLCFISFVLNISFPIKSLTNQKLFNVGYNQSNAMHIANLTGKKAQQQQIQNSTANNKSNVAVNQLQLKSAFYK